MKTFTDIIKEIGRIQSIKELGGLPPIPENKSLGEGTESIIVEISVKHYRKSQNQVNTTPKL